MCSGRRQEGGRPPSPITPTAPYIRKGSTFQELI